MSTRHVHAAAGAPLGSTSARRRPRGRIGGAAGVSHEAGSERLRNALGAGAQILDADGGLVADWDACWLDGRSIDSLADWQSIVERNRLGDVSGAFALAYRDAAGALCLARDAIGERTLFYTCPVESSPAAGQGARAAFASTVPALVTSGLAGRRVDLGGLVRYLAYAYVPGERTLVESIREVLPGEIVRIHPDRITRSPHWSLPPEPGGPAGGSTSGTSDEESLRLGLRRRLEDAVRRRLPEGETVAATLSGGIDSSLVVALAKRLHDQPVLTYSVSFGPDLPNELRWSSMVANHCATGHHVVELSPKVVLHHLDEALALLSDPIGDPLTVPNALLFREISASAGVVLNGEGGDPCFGGPKNQPMLLAELFGDGANPHDADLARERSYLRAHQKCFDDLPAMLSPHVLDALRAEPLETQLTPWLEDPRWRTFVTRLQAINVSFKGAHHILPKVDGESVPFGVLPRSPLFDRDVVEAAFAIPPQLKLQGNVEKYLLKRAVEDLLPREILERPKSGMLVPVEAWFSGPLLPKAKERLLDGLASTGLFRKPWLEELLNKRQAGVRPRRGAKIWLLIALEAWLRKVLGG